MLDHGSHIFIWLGTAHACGNAGAGPASQASGWTRDVVEAAAQGFVAGLADGRFPVPEVRVAVEVLRSILTRSPHLTITPRPRGCSDHRSGHPHTLSCRLFGPGAVH